MKECDKGCVNILRICNIRTFIYLQIVNIVTFVQNRFYYLLCLAERASWYDSG